MLPLCIPLRASVPLSGLRGDRVGAEEGYPLFGGHGKCGGRHVRFAEELPQASGDASRSIAEREASNCECLGP